MNPTPPFNLDRWIDEHAHELKPPVANKQLYSEAEDVIVFVSGGPNSRNDYHVNEGEELFYQLKGDITIGIRDPDGTNPRDVEVRQGDMFLLPRNMPHQPRRPAETIGLIVEFPRAEKALDRLQWYCSECDTLVHDSSWKLERIDRDLKRIMEGFWGGPEEDRTCKKCGTVVQKA